MARRVISLALMLAGGLIASGRIVTLSMAALMTIGGTGIVLAQVNWGPFSLRLSEGMKEQEAINAVGYLPSKVELKTCGTESTQGAWDCKILTYGDLYSNLTIFERRSGGSWVVNSWLVRP